MEQCRQGCEWQAEAAVGVSKAVPPQQHHLFDEAENFHGFIDNLEAEHSTCGLWDDDETCSCDV